MSVQLYTFTKLPGSEGMYFVKDRMSNLVSIGMVAKINDAGGQVTWAAAPVGEKFAGQRRKGFATRGRAASALARFVDTGNRDWIYPR